VLAHGKLNGADQFGPTASHDRGSLVLVLPAAGVIRELRGEHERFVGMQFKEVVHEDAVPEFAVVGVVQQDVRLLHLPAGLSMEDGTGAAADRPRAPIHLVAGSPQVVTLDVGNVWIVVDEQHTGHCCASFRGSVDRRTEEDRVFRRAWPRTAAGARAIGHPDP
jgi:hypothetical protein